MGEIEIPPNHAAINSALKKKNWGGKKVHEGGKYVYLWLIYVAVWQKPPTL